MARYCDQYWRVHGLGNHDGLNPNSFSCVECRMLFLDAVVWFVVFLLQFSFSEVNHLSADTIYACQDKKDDVNAGVKSTALLFGSQIKRILILFGTVTMSALTISGILNSQSPPFFVLAVFGGAFHLAWQLYALDVDSPKSCWQTFEANAFYFGAIVEAGLILDYVLLN
ncbi:hypothetical protein C0989_011903 [Termitomyces sp. Mn162]|nr:hypothetical protein C0989_011903 [Termitomyces sp. Mn162]